VNIEARLTVRGMVQGVGFRWFAMREANKLKLNGWVRNLLNGNVEIEVEGDRNLIEEYIKIIKTGPSYADVQDVKVDWQTFKGKYRDFEIIHWG
jgi:acylphosphatase